MLELRAENLTLVRGKPFKNYKQRTLEKMFALAIERYEYLHVHGKPIEEKTRLWREMAELNRARNKS